MNTEADKPFDVVLSYALADAVVADAVRRRFEAAGLAVFLSSGLGTEPATASAVRQAIQESVAFVVLLTPSHARSESLPLEVGAAWMWSTPIYLLLSDVRTSEVPNYLGRYAAFPVWHGVPAVVEGVSELAKPFSADDRAVLTRAYQDAGVTVDRLVTAPAAGDQLARLFSTATERAVPPTRLVRELLRIRKKGELPKLVKKTAS